MRKFLWIIFEVNFLRNLAAGVLTAILPLYFRQFVDSDAAVGAIYFVGYCAATISSFYSGKLIEHFRKRKILLFTLIFFTVVFALFAFAKHTTAALLLFAIYQFLLSLFIMDIGLYIKHYSSYKILAENTGKLGSLGNIGWLVGPLLGSLIADRFGFEMVFGAASALSIIALLSFFLISPHATYETAIIHKRQFKENIRMFFKNPDLRKTYFNSMGLGFVYSIWDLLPLLMLSIGATIPIIGMTKTLMGVTQTIFEFPIGRLADEKKSERTIFIWGFALLAVFTMALGMTTNLRLFITFFFIAATGSSFLEMTRDSYFYRQIPKNEIELISVYRTSDTLPFLIGQGLAALILLVVPLPIWFIIGGALAFVFIINAYRLKKPNI